MNKPIQSTDPITAMAIARQLKTPTADEFSLQRDRS